MTKAEAPRVRWEVPLNRSRRLARRLGVPRRILRRLRRGRAKKRDEELGYWRKRQTVEGELEYRHYEHYFTAHFGLTRSFYEGKSVLDVGCGPRGSLEWAPPGGARVGLDPLVDEYEELGIGRHAMSYVKGSAERMPFDTASFDVVTSFNSLDHVDDVERAVAEIKRVLRPGGLFLLLTDVGHYSTWSEPQEFGWEVLDLFPPELALIEERRYRHVAEWLFGNILANEPHDGSTPYGILSAKFRRT